MDEDSDGALQTSEDDSGESTDDFELDRPESDSNPTQTWLGRNGGEGERELPLQEANIILIAHPDHKMLGSRFRLHPMRDFRIGRSGSADVSLPEVLSLSRLHARLYFNKDKVVIEDLHSTNGTYVNDDPVLPRRVLKSGDRFQVGAVHFKFLHERDPEDAYYRAIYSLVVQDGLTEIFNRRKFEEEMEREYLRAKRYRRPLSLILFDIDSFKEVNDSCGHLCGDHVLKQVARQASQLTRPEQVLARLGGDEMAVLCPETPLEGAMSLAKRLRANLESSAIGYSGIEVAITCSFGVGTLEGGMRSSEDLFVACDRALYRSKQTGGNRVTASNPGSTDH
ncbi:MAG TPA: GGDEF domain-containing protein [Thermoanaerobaculia bacterium]|nr:GGDEF domain-containing protein [Thermoanaerobaculia bacterium]